MCEKQENQSDRLEMEPKRAGPSSSNEQIEWETLKSARLKEGYREGVGAGEEVSAQEGFDCGYAIGLRLVQDIAYLRGILWAILKGAPKDQLQPDAALYLKDAGTPLKDLIEELANMEKTLVKQMQERTTAKEECPPTAVVLPPDLSNRLEEIKTTCSDLMADLRDCQVPTDSLLPLPI